MITTAEEAEERASMYDRSRPPYASTVIDFVSRHLGSTIVPVVADIGCGTGLSTRLFRRLAAELVAVEPDAGMRAVAERELGDLDVIIHAGRAEETGLANGSIDLVVAASCFEWFEPAAAAAEFRRVLSPHGHVLLMWNHRVALDMVGAEWGEVWLRHMGPRLGPAPDDIDSILVPAFLGADMASFREVVRHPYDRDRLRHLALSSAYAPSVTRRRRRTALLDAIDTFHANHAADGRVDLLFETVAFLGRIRSSPGRGLG